MNKTNIKILIIVIIISLFQLECYAQHYDIDSLIRSRPLSKTDQKNRAYDLLYDAICAENIDVQLISGLQSYLNQNFDDFFYRSLTLEENLYIYLYTKNWDSAFDVIKKITKKSSQNSVNYTYQNNLNYRPNYNSQNRRLCIVLTEKINKININEEISNSNLSEEQKDFLILFREYLQIILYNSNYYYQNNERKIENIQTEYKKLKNTYPESEYLNWIELYKVYPNNIQFEFNGKFGASIFTNNLGKNFKNPPFFGFDFKFYYKKFFVGAELNAVFTSLKQNLSIMRDSLVIWDKEKDGISSINLGLNLGYDLVRTKKFVLSPSIGISMTNIEPSGMKKEKIRPELKGISYTNNSLSAGIDFKYVFNRSSQTLFVNQYSYCGVELSYRYNYGQIFKNNTIVRGDFHTITISFFLHTIKNKSIKI